MNSVVAPIPTKIQQHDPETLAITWADGDESLYNVRELRLACGCAECVDEWTGTSRLDSANVPQDVRPRSIEPVGRYAIQIRWTDGHESGIYSFERLRELSASAPEAP